MDLPSLLNIAIGLIFIYLILSLLAAEIQETLATLFQWRGKHLKEAIFNLLIGDNLYRNPSDVQATLLKKENEKAEKLVENIYKNPLIVDINQEARKGIPVFMRRLAWGIADRFRRSIDGETPRNVPAYIPSKIFSTALMERMKVSNFAKNRGAIYLSRLIDTNIVEDIERLINNSLIDNIVEEAEQLIKERHLENSGLVELLQKTRKSKNLKIEEFNELGMDLKEKLNESNELEKELEEKLGEFREKTNSICGRLALGKASLENAVERLNTAFDEFEEEVKQIEDSKQNWKNSKAFLKELAEFQKEVFIQKQLFKSHSENEGEQEAHSMTKFRPTLAQIMELFDSDAEIHMEVGAVLYDEVIRDIKNYDNDNSSQTSNSEKTTGNNSKTSIKKKVSNLRELKLFLRKLRIICDTDPTCYSTEENTVKGYLKKLREHIEELERFVEGSKEASSNRLPVEDEKIQGMIVCIAKTVTQLKPCGQESYKPLAKVKEGNPPSYRVKKDTPLYRAYLDTWQSVEFVEENLPSELCPSLVALANNAQIKARSVEDELKLLQQEITQWFDSSMERATGVYKRNAKGVAFLIGLVLAISLNTDSLYIANRLSHDSILTKAIADNVSTLYAKVQEKKSTPDNQPKEDQSPLEDLRKSTEEVLDLESFPIGWNDNNLKQQIGWKDKAKGAFPVINLINCLPGWLLTGLAISMGAPFWFELLGKIVNVRNTGTKPKSSVESEN
jgi:hypothetical protein